MGVIIIAVIHFDILICIFFWPCSEDDDDDDETHSDSGALSQTENSSKPWNCPWGSAVVDDIVPSFKTILEENYLSSVDPMEDTKRNRMRWWKWRTKLDQRLNMLLRYITCFMFTYFSWILLKACNLFLGTSSYAEWNCVENLHYFWHSSRKLDLSTNVYWDLS